MPYNELIQQTWNLVAEARQTLKESRELRRQNKELIKLAHALYPVSVANGNSDPKAPYCRKRTKLVNPKRAKRSDQKIKTLAS